MNLPRSQVRQSSALPNWYVERYDESGDTIWLPVVHRAWTFPGLEETTAERTRGQARAFAAGEFGESFTSYRCRKVWMRNGSGEDEIGWTDDMAWECPKDTEGALPYWRVDYAPRKVAK